jgi:hypothetical protein
MRDEPMPTREIDDATSAKMSAGPTRHFPRFIKLFARQTIRIANDARDAIEERLARKMREQLRRKTRAMSWIQQNGESLAHLAKGRILRAFVISEGR